MRKIVSLITCISVAFSLSSISFAESETAETLSSVTETDGGYIVFADNENLLTEIEENYIVDSIRDAVKEKDISIGVVSESEITQDTAQSYYEQISDVDSDFALMLFNGNEHTFFFYGSAEEEFADDENAFWMTESYFEGDYCFAAALQFPLDIQYHYVAEYDYTETTEAVADVFPEDYFSESASGIYTVSLENGCIALLHDLDNSLTADEEEEVLTDLMSAVRDKDFSIGIVITDNIGDDKSDYGVMDFADLYYENYCGINTDGILLLINNDTKYDWISTSGSCIDVFDNAIDPIFDEIYDYLVDGDYSMACQGFVQGVKYCSEYEYDYYNDYYNDYYDDYYDEYVDINSVEDAFFLAVFALFIAVIAVAIFAGSVNKSYTMSRNVSAANYKLVNSLVFTQSTDTFLRTYTTRRRVSSSSSGSSRSGSRSGGSSHRSSSGGRHGGGGRRR